MFIIALNLIIQQINILSDATLFYYRNIFYSNLKQQMGNNFRQARGQLSAQQRENKPNYSEQNIRTNKIRNTSEPKQRYAVKIARHFPISQQASKSLLRLGSQQIPDVSDADIYQIKEKKASYQGTFKNYLPHGPGITHFRNGGLYAGEFVEGDASGKGIYIFQNGYVYQGEFKQSKFQGKGTLYSANQQFKYNGAFINGLPHGEGVEQTISSDNKKTEYKGEFKKGKKQGYGVYYWADNKRYQGYFMEGLMHGKGTLFAADNSIIFDGDFRHGSKEGYGIFKTSSGSYEGQFSKDQLNGKGTFVWNDGKVYQGQFLKTKMHGQGMIYFKSGQVSKGTWWNNHNQQIDDIENNPKTYEKIKQITDRHKDNARQSMEKWNQPHFENDQLQLEKTSSKNSSKKQDFATFAT